MLEVSALYSVTYVIFLSNRQPLKNKRYSLLFIGKSDKPYKLIKYQFAPLIISIYLFRKILEINSIKFLLDFSRFRNIISVLIIF
jgi:hypothetical protein